jgi:hypothetical protein
VEEEPKVRRKNAVRPKSKEAAGERMTAPRPEHENKTAPEAAPEAKAEAEPPAAPEPVPAEPPPAADDAQEEEK